MKKHLLVCLIALGLITNVTGCTSSDSQNEAEVAESNDESFAEEGEADFAEEGGEVAAEGEEAAPAEGGTETAEAAEGGAPEDELSLDEGEEVAEAESASGDQLPEEVMEDPAAKPAEGQDAQAAQGEPQAPADDALFAGGEGTTAESAPPPEPVEEPAPTDVAASTDAPTEPPAEMATEAPTETMSETASSDYSEPAPAPSFVPVQKIRDAAFSKAGSNLNRVYIARPGDNTKSVSQKIFGKNRSKDLLAWNPHLNRGMKTGDKVYYPSPNDPDDTRMLTYYEDSGVPAATHITAEGENIRSLSKELLGSSESWKEVWATNMSVESKGDLPAGVELRYWPEGSAPAAPALTQAAAPNQELPEDAPPAPPADAMPPQDPSMAGATDSSMMPPSDPTMPQANDPLASAENPPPMDAAGSVEPPPPPPPMDDGGEIAPEPPNPVAKKAPIDGDVGADSDMMMMMGLGVIMIAGAVFLLAMVRKNRAKRIDLGQTQV